MFTLFRTVLDRDYGTPYYNPLSSADGIEEHPKMYCEPGLILRPRVEKDLHSALLHLRNCHLAEAGCGKPAARPQAPQA